VLNLLSLIKLSSSFLISCQAGLVSISSSLVRVVNSSELTNNNNNNRALFSENYYYTTQQHIKEKWFVTCGYLKTFEI
jgi:hypothetical protein